MQKFGSNKDVNGSQNDVRENLENARQKKNTAGNKRHKHRKNDNTVGSLCIILAVLVVTAVLMLLMPNMLVDEPEIKDNEPKNPASIQPDVPEETAEPEIDYGDPFTEISKVAPVTDAARRKGVYTILVVGLDKVSGSTDTILLGCFDTKAGELNVTTLSRDLFINSEYDVKKLNCIYPAGLRSGRNGIDDLKTAVSDITGYYVDNYAVIDIETAARLVDAIGGLYFNVPQDMYYEDPAQDLYIDIKAGYQMLTGEQTVQVYRFREGYVMGDIDRVSVQQDLLMAIVKQTLSLGNIPNFGKIVHIISEGVETDMSAGNIVYYAAEYLKLGTADVHFLEMPGNPCNICGLAYYTMDIGKWIDMLNESFNPFDSEITSKDLNAVTYDGWYIYSTTGRLAGGFESFYGFNDPGFWGEPKIHTYIDD